MAPTPEPVSNIDQTRQQVVVDRIGQIQEYLAAERARQAPFLDEKAKLEAEVLTWFENTPAEDRGAVESPEFIASISARETSRKVFDSMRCYKLLKMGLAQFLENIKIPLKLIDKNIPEDKHPLFLEEKRTGARNITVVRKPPAA